jgi:hypothetical protein
LALSGNTPGLGSLRTNPPTAKLSFALNKLPLPPPGKVTNLAAELEITKGK